MRRLAGPSGLKGPWNLEGPGDIEGNIHETAHWRGSAAEAGCEGMGGFFAGDNDVSASGDAGQQGRDVGGGDYFQEGVGGVVLQAANLAGGVVEGQAGIGTEGTDGGFVEAFLGRDAEVVFVAEVDEAHDAPEVVDPVGVIERHAPAVRLGRETPQEQDACTLREEGLKGMLFDVWRDHEAKLSIFNESYQYIVYLW